MLEIVAISHVSYVFFVILIPIFFFAGLRKEFRDFLFVLRI